MHILLVEDSREDASLLTEFLAEEKNAPSVSWVTDGREALDFVSQQGKYENVERPDLIVLDLAMPRLGGYETLKELKKTGPYCDIPVIVISTSYNPADHNSCIGFGAKAFYSKPSNLQGYEDLVQRLMRFEFPRILQDMQTASSNLH